MTSHRKGKLSEAQKRWLDDPRPYFNEYTDRTARALLNRGFIEITERDFGSMKAGYAITPAGRTALREGE